jgi:hypothetical protein
VPGWRPTTRTWRISCRTGSDRRAVPARRDAQPVSWPLPATINQRSPANCGLLEPAAPGADARAVLWSSARRTCSRLADRWTHHCRDGRHHKGITIIFPEHADHVLKSGTVSVTQWGAEFTAAKCCGPRPGSESVTAIIDWLAIIVDRPHRAAKEHSEMNVTWPQLRDGDRTVRDLNKNGAHRSLRGPSRPLVVRSG